jgi:hypothetical protein
MIFRPRHLYASLLLLAPVLAAAQMHHVDKPEQVTRAVGVYEWTGPLDKPKAARLVPVSLFINDQMRDAGIYLAQPVPFALETGNVYEIQFAGQPKGTLDLKLARDIAAQSAIADDPEGSWYGYGLFAPPGAPKKSTLKPTVALAAIAGSEDDSRPRFVAPRAEAPATPAAKTSSRAPASDDDSERPTLRHRDDSEDTNGGKEKKQKSEKPHGYVTAAGAPLGDDPDRPTLRAGKAASDDTPPLEGLPADMHQAVAVSDPTAEDLHDFAREWDSSTDRADTLVALEKTARDAVAEYMKANALAPARPSAEDTAVAPPQMVTPSRAADSASSPPVLRRTPQGIATRTAPPPSFSKSTTRKAKSAKAKTAAPMPVLPITLTHEDLRGYSLTYGGLPTFIYTAAVPATLPNVATAEVHVSVALVAQRMPTGELQIALRSVTDSGHLNRTPEMRFVDVVDPNGSHRASMLFEQRFAHSRQFALYRLISANAEQTFTTGPIF